MKATIERAKLLRCLSHVQSVVERRNTIPILSNVLIEASSDGHVRIMATDLDLQVIESLDAVSVEGAGAITVSAHLLFDIARKLPDGSQVSLETADNRMAVKAGQALSNEEQRALLHDLEACDSPRTCPHGRPTMIHLSVDMLERQFGRRGAR